MFTDKRFSALLVLCCGIQSCHVFFCASTAVSTQTTTGPALTQGNGLNPIQGIRFHLSEVNGSWCMAVLRWRTLRYRAGFVIALRFFFCSLDTLSSHSVSGGSHVFQSSSRVCHLSQCVTSRCPVGHRAQFSTVYSQCFLRFLEPIALNPDFRCFSRGHDRVTHTRRARCPAHARIVTVISCLGSNNDEECNEV